MSKMKFKESPFRIIALLYVCAILLFSFAYMMPSSHIKEISFVDSWFLSASAMSVTGLTPINITEDLTTIGQLILMIQIQIGGIGIMVILGLMFMMFKEKISLSQQTLMSFDQNQKDLKSIKGLIVFIFSFAFITELLGFALIYPTVHKEYGDISTSIFISAFHSVASFTNAGFDLFGGSMADYATHTVFVLTTCLLIFLGSIGFPTVAEIVTNRGRKKSLFTKINLSMHTILIVIGFILFFLIEFGNKFSDYMIQDKILNSLFLSITSRNAGLSTVDLPTLTASSLFLMMILMFIGGSATSCGGGIRVTTFAVLCAKMKSIVRGREDVVLFKKGIHGEDVSKSFLVFFVFLGLFVFSCFTLSLVENFKFEQIMFEVMSALTTTGLSIGITADLTDFSKVILTILMITGRIGVVSIIYSFIKPKKSNAKYVKEHVVVG